MSPKFIEVTRYVTTKDDPSALVVFVNPRRLNRFQAVVAPSAQPDLRGKLGTILDFGRGETLIVRETVDEMKNLLRK